MGGGTGKAEEAGEGVWISQSPTPTRHSLMTRGKALKSGGAVPQTLFPESGGGSRQQSHGDPCCGTRETEEGVQVLKKNVNRGLSASGCDSSLPGFLFEIPGTECCGAAAFPAQTASPHSGTRRARLAHFLLGCDVRNSVLNVAAQASWHEWLFC